MQRADIRVTHPGDPMPGLRNTSPDSPGAKQRDDLVGPQSSADGQHHRRCRRLYRRHLLPARVVRRSSRLRRWCRSQKRQDDSRYQRQQPSSPPRRADTPGTSTSTACRIRSAQRRPAGLGDEAIASVGLAAALPDSAAVQPPAAPPRLATPPAARAPRHRAAGVTRGHGSSTAAAPGTPAAPSARCVVAVCPRMAQRQRTLGTIAG